MVSLAGLSQAFGNTSDPQYLVPSHSHTAALKLLSGLPKDARNVRVVIGEPGVGKTILLLSLLEKLRGSALTVHLFWTQLGRGEFLSYFLRKLGVVHPASDVRQAQEQLSGVLEAEFRQGRKVVVAIDEAHDLDLEALGELAEVLDCSSARNKDLEVVLAGLPLLSGKLASRQLQKLWERISETTTLSPLTPEETASYIHRRLEVSGCQGAIPFTPDAIATIATLTEGIPRNVNNLCSAGLFVAAERSRTTIDSSTVVEARARWEGGSITHKPLEEMLPSPVPALTLSGIDQASSCSAESLISLSPANAQDALSVPDSPSSTPGEPPGESGDLSPMADRLRQWFGNQRLAWSGTTGELAAAVDAGEAELAHTLEEDRDQLRGFGIAVSLRQPIGQPRQVTLRRLPEPEPTSAAETKEPEQIGASKSKREQTDAEEISHEPIPGAADAPRPRLDSSPGLNMEPPSDVQAGDHAFEEQAKTAPTETASSEFADHLLDLVRANSQQWGEARDSRLRRIISALFIVLVVIAVGIASTYGPVAKRKYSVVRRSQQLAEAKAATKATRNGTTQTGSATDNEQTLAAGGNVSAREPLPLGEQPSLIRVLKNRGVQLDLAEDMKGFEQAAVAGDPNAQFELGTAYALGRGVPADAVTAYTWLTLAFVNGKPDAESLLRELTRTIHPPDLARIRWNLGEMYANGIGVPAADKITAYMWQLLAASAGETRSSRARSELAATMTPDEVSQARVRASEWLKRHHRPHHEPF
jgi:general secretion pathway protein A